VRIRLGGAWSLAGFWGKLSWDYWGLPSYSIRFHLFHVSDARNKAILLLDAVNWSCFDPVLWICVVVYAVTAWTDLSLKSGSEN
jgi:hypothetical protein